MVPLQGVNLPRPLWSNWHRNWKVQVYINICTYSTWELLFFLEESPGWWNIIIFTSDTIDLTEMGVQGLYRNFPGILVRELFQKKTKYPRSEGNIHAAGSSLMWSPPQHETQKNAAKLFNECDSLINRALMLKQWDPFASGFGVGFWVSQHLLTEYLEH